MEFSVKSGSPEKQRSACIVVGVFEPRRLTSVAEQLDIISEGYISNLLRKGDLEGQAGQMLLLHHVPNILSERVLLVGCGKERELDERQYKQIISKSLPQFRQAMADRRLRQVQMPRRTRNTALRINGFKNLKQVQIKLSNATQTGLRKRTRRSAYRRPACNYKAFCPAEGSALRRRMDN